MTTILCALIQLYRWILSPFVGKFCRFEPTCSAYAMEALQCHGSLKGSWLTVKRLCRCHPITFLGGSFGFDPVPTRARSNKS